MATTKFQGFETYRYAQIALKKDKSVQDNEATIDTTMMKTTQKSPSNKNNEQELEVDYENNVTVLYEAISNSQWEVALRALKDNPIEARTWVVRYKEDNSKGILWRFLPLHSATARQPPVSVVNHLLQAYPEAAGSCDDQGMYPLHYASGNQASAAVLQCLINEFPDAAKTCDPNGMLPIHYMAQWGPSDTQAIDTLLFAHQNISNAKDDQGNTPLYYAEDGDYRYRQEMIAALKQGPIGITYKKSFRQQTLPPSSRKKFNTPTTAHTSPMSEIQDDASFSASSKAPMAAPMQVIFQKRRQEPSSVTLSSARNVNDAPFSGNKTVAKLTAQINKLKAEITYQTAEHEEIITEQREAHRNSMDDLQFRIVKSQEDNANIRNDILAKEEYGKYVEGRTIEVEKDINHFNEQNEKLERERTRFEEDFKMEKSKADAFQLRIKTLLSKMSLMIEDQRRIEVNLSDIENDVKVASEERQQKLKELYDEEVNYGRQFSEEKQLYGAGGPTILSGLGQQRVLMDNCVAVLAECEEKRDDDDLLNRDS